MTARNDEFPNTVAGAGPVDRSAIDLGPGLPFPLYTSSAVWNPERIGAVTIYCSDGRWGESFDEFCHRSLNIPRYDRFAVPGGPAWFARPEANVGGPRFAAREQLDFLVQVHELERIVLVTHFGCAFYTEMLRCEPHEALATQLADLEGATDTLNRWFPGLTIEAYIAMRQENQISFHQLPSARMGVTSDMVTA